MREFTVHRNGIHLCYECIGRVGEPLLLISGLAADKHYWHDEFCAALLRNGFHVARFDNRDSGRSTHLDGVRAPSRRRARRDPGAPPYGLEDMAKDAAAVLDALGWASAHIVGHSMGAMIAQTLAIDHPTRVRSLTCVSATPSPDIGRLSVMTMLRLSRTVPGVLGGQPPRGPAEAGERLVRQHRVIGSPGYPRDEAWLRHLGELMYARGGFDPAARARQAAAMLAHTDRRPDLARLRIPAVVLHGRDDRLIRCAGGRAIAEAIPDATLVLLPGMGHDLPKPLWPSIIEEIRTVADRAGGDTCAHR
ncbi:alpha/beta fold hydrolase [Mycobacterium sp. SMC-2]|uniref:alpha/beta fold hydrolase n=1 Tax=Mycobacterium sp. SMC-2 TaxID=2857058 RepID=UPI0021B1A706|nr:alpha/beta hydrolase [Mycobacterium sp. SMC-2]UXA07882.1 alpha/beta fold hydrolase [Mycobacterium sp. SMC-2]